MTINLKRVYASPAPSDGTRILVERLWPRGLSREKARVDAWPRDVAPSTELRKWFDHRPERWDAFRQRYFIELDERPEAVSELRGLLKGTVTFVFASREEQLNNAVALREYLER
jgi:uncharacterized protein YeaO (DUF488 family)